MDEILKRDQNFITVLGGVTNDVDQDIIMLRVDPVTRRLLVNASISGGVVTSLNELTGAVVLAAGSNITLTPVGNTITISASGGGSTYTAGTGIAISGSNVISNTGITSIAKFGDTPITGAVTLSEGHGIQLVEVGQNIEIKIDSTAVVTSLDGLSGGITLASGANTITISDNDPLPGTINLTVNESERYNWSNDHTWTNRTTIFNVDRRFDIQIGDPTKYVNILSHLSDGSPSGIRFSDTDENNTVTLRSPATLSNSWFLDLPVDVGTAGQVLAIRSVAIGVVTTEWITPSGSSGLTVGTTTIASGTTTRILYDNAGVLGEYSISGTGNVAMTTSPAFTTPSLGAATYTTLSGGNITDSALTAGRVVFAGTAGILDDDSSLNWDNTNKTLAVGTPDIMVVHGVTINGQFEANSDTLSIFESHTHSATVGAAATFYGARSRGTTASPTIVSSGDWVRIDGAVAYDGTDYEQVGYTAWLVGGTPGSNDMPGKWVLAVTPDGSFSPVEAINVANTGIATFAQTIAGSITGNAATASLALALKSATTTVDVSAATAPTSGQVLTATSGTTATWQTPSGGGGANTALSNLASVAINTSLISDTTNTDDLGSSSILWRHTYTTDIELGNASDTTIARVSAGVISVEGSTVALASNKLSFFSATTSAELAGVISDETGTGALVFGTSPTIVTPTIASFTNATHNHQNATGGGTLDLTAIGGATVLPLTNGGTGITVIGPRMFAYGRTTVNSTNVTTEEGLASVLIPAGTLGNNDEIEIWTLWSGSGSGSKQPRVRLHTASGTGGTIYSTISSGTLAAGQTIVRIVMKNSASAQEAPPTNIIVGASASAPITSSLSTASDIYINFTSQKATGTDSLSLKNYTVTIKRI